MKEDKVLYKEFLEGNKQAFEELVIKYKNNLIYFITRYVKSIEIAEDIFQDIIVYILENKNYYNFEYSFKTYLYMIAKSRTIDFVKREKKTESIDNSDFELEDTKLLEEIILDKNRQKQIQNVMKKMNQEYQLVIYLTQVEGLSYKEASLIMNKKESQIKTLSFNARKKLRKLMIDEKIVELKENKLIKLIVCFLIIAVLPLIAIATKEIIMYDDLGRVIVYAGGKKPDIPDDTPIAFVIHKESESEKKANKDQEHEKALAEKEAFENKINEDNELENDSKEVTEEEKAEMDKVILAEHNYEDEAKVVLKRYYGNNEIEDLFKQLKSETSKSTGGSLISDYTIPDSGIQLIKLMFDIIEGNKATISEKEIVTKYLKTIEPLGIRDDDELKYKLENLKEK